MKKIKNIKDLEHEKLRLRLKQLELEKQMDNSWKSIKGNFSQNTFKTSGQRQGTNGKTGDHSFLTGILSYGAGLLSHKLGEIAGKNVQDAAEKMIGKVAETINEFFVKRKRRRK